MSGDDGSADAPADHADDNDLGDVLEAVRKRVTPDSDERAALEAAVVDLAERTRAAVADLPVEADVVHVGSTARDTWLPGDRDIDLFVRFSPDVSRADLERWGLRVGEAVLPDARTAYAEHPYVTGTVDGFDVDLVPCYDVPDATAIESAVDRTPFHTAYLAERVTPADAAEIRLAKQFLTAAGVYGSDLRTRGFSGYLTELLVLAYGDFAGLLRAAADWLPPVVLDPADHGEREFDDPLVVVDPTDPGRNVAAVVAAESVARCQHHARALLADPDEAAFESTDPEPLDADAVRAHLERRGTHPLAVRLDVPALVDDQLYPQLRRSLGGLRDGLAAEGFSVLRGTALAEPLPADAAATPPGGRPTAPAAAADGERTVALLVELAHGELPAVERHEGPPVHVREHAAAFYDTYDATDDERTYGPFLDGGRYVVERERSVRTARQFATEELSAVALGAAVEDALADGYDVLEGDAVADLAGTFGTDLARYFEPTV
ncbi:MAG: CCA tRNA nucleotidyltransferase [Halobacteriaceae archaeon]